MEDEVPFKRRTAHASDPQGLTIGHGCLFGRCILPHLAPISVSGQADPRTHSSPCRVVCVISIHPHPRSRTEHRLMLECGSKPTMATNEVHKAANVKLDSKPKSFQIWGHLWRFFGMCSGTLIVVHHKKQCTSSAFPLFRTSETSRQYDWPHVGHR